MPTSYPSIAFLTKKRESINPIRHELTMGGKLVAQDFSADRYYDIEVEHQWLTQSQVDTLTAFFGTYGNTECRIGPLSDGNSYDFLHIFEPQEIAINGTFFHVRQRLKGKQAS